MTIGEVAFFIGAFIGMIIWMEIKTLDKEASHKLREKKNRMKARGRRVKNKVKRTLK